MLLNPFPVITFSTQRPNPYHKGTPGGACPLRHPHLKLDPSGKNTGFSKLTVVRVEVMAAPVNQKLSTNSGASFILEAICQHNGYERLA